MTLVDFILVNFVEMINFNTFTIQIILNMICFNNNRV